MTSSRPSHRPEELGFWLLSRRCFGGFVFNLSLFWYLDPLRMGFDKALLNLGAEGREVPLAWLLILAVATRTLTALPVGVIVRVTRCLAF